MNWIPLTTEQQIEDIITGSGQGPVIVFKHSTRCSISSTTLSRLERNWNEEEMKGVRAYYLDLIQYRPVSGRLADVFSVEHQSPQVLLIQNGQSIWDASHYDIQYEEIRKVLSK